MRTPSTPRDGAENTSAAPKCCYRSAIVLDFVKGESFRRCPVHGETEHVTSSRFDRPPSPWPWVEINDSRWLRVAAFLLLPFTATVYVILFIPAIVWSACAVHLDIVCNSRGPNFWTPLWEGTAYYEARWRKRGGSRG